MHITNQISHYTYINKTVMNGEEIIKNKLKELQPQWTNHTCRKIQIAVDKECLVKINGEDELLIKPEYGLNIEYQDKDVESTIILSDDISLYAIIGY